MSFAQGFIVERENGSYYKERIITTALLASIPIVMKSLYATAFVLVIIGGLNWGLVALGSYMGSDWNVVNLILGSVSWLENLVYLLIGLSALLLIFVKGEKASSVSDNHVM